MNEPFENWKQFLAWLDSLGMFHMELDQGRMLKALALTAMEDVPYPVIQVVGTNGKGSTSTFLAALSRQHGLKTGLFTSPHFLDPRERIRINGRMIPRDEWVSHANFLFARLADSIKPTYFEFLTLLALRLFTRHGVDLAIFEAGLGGANDATSVIPAQICCFTPIALDHAHIIGPDINSIARDKSAALQGKKLAFSTPQFPPVARILAHAAESLDIPLQFIHPLPEVLASRLTLHGAHQLENASLALAAWRGMAAHLGMDSNGEKETAAINSAFIAGRMQIIPATSEHPAILLDGAHNPHAMKCLASQLDKPPCVIYSALADKDWKNSLGILCLGSSAPVIVPQIANQRAASAEDIAAWCENRFDNRATPVPEPYSMLKALGLAADFANSTTKPILVCGSLFLLAAFYKLFPHYLHENGDEHDNPFCP